MGFSTISESENYNQVKRISIATKKDLLNNIISRYIQKKKTKKGLSLERVNR